MFLQDIHAVGHCCHDVNQSGTIGTKVLEHRTQEVHVTRLVHAVENLDNGIHCLALVVESLDASLLHAERLLNEVVLTLDGGEQLIEGCCADLGHQSHCIARRTEGQQILRADTADVGQTHQALRELNDIGASSGRGGTQLEDGAGSLLHRLLNAVLRNKTHYLYHLRQFRECLLTHVLAQGHLHLFGSLDEASKTLYTIVLTDTELGTCISQLVQHLNGVAGVNLSNVAIELVDGLATQSTDLTDIGK